MLVPLKNIYTKEGQLNVNLSTNIAAQKLKEIGNSIPKYGETWSFSNHVFNSYMKT